MLADLAWISYLHEVKTPDAPWFELVIIHHTDCGSGLMADDDLRAGFASRGFDEPTLRATAVVDPGATVAVDVQRILDSPSVYDRIAVSATPTTSTPACSAKSRQPTTRTVNRPKGDQQSKSMTASWRMVVAAYVPTFKSLLIISTAPGGRSSGVDVSARLETFIEQLA